MESALYGIFTLVGEVSVRFQILHQLVWKSRTRALPWSNLYFTADSGHPITQEKISQEDWEPF